MRPDRHGPSLRQIRTLFTMGTAVGLTDAELLERFAAREGEAAELAFAALVERHGPMVLRVCRQVLRDSHAAEDAFQAAFLVLARKGRSFRGRDSLAPWLQQVAWRTAAHLRADVSRRRRHEQRAAATGGEVVVDRAWDDLGEALHEELGRLPARYRLALVLCYLEGLSSEQAARQLGWPAATVRSRLTRGRERLRRRLMRRGLAPSAVALAAALAPRSAWAAVRPASVSAAARAAVLVTTGRVAAGAVPASILTLTEGVILNMAMTKLKLAAVTLLVPGLLAIGAMLPAQPPGPATTQGTAGSGGPSGELPSLTALPQGTPGADPVPGVLRGEVTTQGPGGPGGRFGSNRLTRSGSQAPALSPSESDRLKAVEVKLDEILQLLKNTGARGGSAAPITSGIGTAQPLERVGAPAAAGVRRAAAPSASSSTPPPNSSGGGSVSLGLGVAAGTERDFRVLGPGLHGPRALLFPAWGGRLHPARPPWRALPLPEWGGRVGPAAPLQRRRTAEPDAAEALTLLVHRARLSRVWSTVALARPRPRWRDG